MWYIIKTNPFTSGLFKFDDLKYFLGEESLGEWNTAEKTVTSKTNVVPVFPKKSNASKSIILSDDNES